MRDGTGCVAVRPGRAALVAVLGALLVGCSGTPTPPATEAPAPLEGYETSLFGYVSKTYEADFDASVAGVKAALTALGFHIVEETGALFEKTLEIESEDRTSVVVAIAAVTKSTTKVSIKVGYLLGNRDAAQRIHSEIDDEIAGRREESKDKAKRWGRSVGGNPIVRSSGAAPSPSRTPPTPRPR